MRIGNSAYIGDETLIRLAVQNADKSCTTQGLAEWIHRSVSYTEPLMAQLRNAGIVVTAWTRRRLHPRRTRSFDHRPGGVAGRRCAIEFGEQSTKRRHVLSRGHQ